MVGKAAIPEAKQLEDVIGKLERQEKPISKKEACAILGIAYNTTRLAKLIDDYKKAKDIEKRLKASMVRTPLSEREKKQILEAFVRDESISAIAKDLFRSPAVVKRFILSCNIPISKAGASYFHDVPLLQESSIRDDYSIGDLVYSARYGCLAEIVSRYKDSDTHGAIFNIYLLGKEQQRAYQPYYELADLTKVQHLFDIKIIAAEGKQARRIV